MDFPHISDFGRYERAEWYQERIENQIQEISQELKPGQELLVEAILNDGRHIYPTWFGYHNPNMLVIDGIDAKRRSVRLLAAHTDLQILITIVESTENSPGPKIGFQARPEDK